MEPYKREVVYFVVLLNWGLLFVAGDGVVHALFHGFGMGLVALFVVVSASLAYETNVPESRRRPVGEWRKVARVAAVVAVPANVALLFVAATVPQVVFYAAFLLVALASRAGLALPDALARPRVAPAWLTG